MSCDENSDTAIMDKRRQICGGATFSRNPFDLFQAR